MIRRIIGGAVSPLHRLARIRERAEAPGPRVVVGPNMLVSRDGDFPHVELIVAANPKNVKNLLGGAITYTRPRGGTACRTYATTDGGTTWWPSEFSEQVEWGGADPYVAFTPQGTGIFSALTFQKDEKDQGTGIPPRLAVRGRREELGQDDEPRLLLRPRADHRGSHDRQVRRADLHRSRYMAIRSTRSGFSARRTTAGAGPGRSRRPTAAARSGSTTSSRWSSPTGRWWSRMRISSSCPARPR